MADPSSIMTDNTMPGSGVGQKFSVSNYGGMGDSHSQGGDTFDTNGDEAEPKMNARTLRANQAAEAWIISQGPAIDAFYQNAEQDYLNRRGNTSSESARAKLIKANDTGRTKLLASVNTINRRYVARATRDPASNEVHQAQHARDLTKVREEFAQALNAAS